MNIVSDPKSIPTGSVLSPEANQAAALATASGVLTIDLDAIVANWRKLEKTAVPAECAGVIKADVIIGKQRHGPTGTVQLQFEASFTRFADLATDTHLPDRH